MYLPIAFRQLPNLLFLLKHLILQFLFEYRLCIYKMSKISKKYDYNCMYYQHHCHTLVVVVVIMVVVVVLVVMAIVT